MESDDGLLDISYLNQLSNVGKKVSGSENLTSNSTKKKNVLNRLPSGDAVKAVLEKKRRNEEERVQTFMDKRNNLLALRANDKNANRRVNAMIKRTKGYSKSVLEDAKDLTTVRGEQQCDEDDYGYESTMSQQIFDNLANKYREMPEDERLKFKKVKTGNLDDVKNRVLSSLKQQEQEESGPRKRKRKNTSNEFINDGDPYDNSFSSQSRDDEKMKSGSTEEKSYKHDRSKSPETVNTSDYKSKEKQDREIKRKLKEKEERERRRRRLQNCQQQPTMSFADLMKVAQDQRANSAMVKTEDLVQEKIKEREELLKRKNERPLTAQEKEEQEEQRLRKLRRKGKLPNVPIERLKELQKFKKNKGNSGETSEIKIKEEKNINKLLENVKIEKALGSDKASRLKGKELRNIEPKIKDKSKYFALPSTHRPSAQVSDKSLPTMKTSKREIPAVASSSKGKYQTMESKKKSQSYAGVNENLKYTINQKSPHLDIKTKQVSSNSLHTVTSKSKYFPPKDSRQPALKSVPSTKYGRRVESDSEEFDSEMDDFIDDGEDELDYSKEIKKLFNYDKSSYRDKDDDLSDMEVGFGQVEKEEKRSARIGLMEDLEDMRLEEEHKKRKLMLKKRGR